MAEKSDFDRLSRDWEDHTGHHSNMSIVMRHESCRAIVAMGKEAIPWCLARLRRCRGLNWSMILYEITGENPMPQPERVSPGFVGIDVEACAKAWIKWGQEHGHIK